MRTLTLQLERSTRTEHISTVGSKLSCGRRAAAADCRGQWVGTSGWEVQARGPAKGPLHFRPLLPLFSAFHESVFCKPSFEFPCPLYPASMCGPHQLPPI